MRKGRKQKQHKEPQCTAAVLELGVRTYAQVGGELYIADLLCNNRVIANSVLAVRFQGDRLSLYAANATPAALRPVIEAAICYLHAYIYRKHGTAALLMLRAAQGVETVVADPATYAAATAIEVIPIHVFEAYELTWEPAAK